MMNANERIGGEKEGISRLLKDTGLVDIFSLHKASSCTIATHNKGTHRIDFMFGTSNLLPYIHQCGYTAFHQDIISDHRGMFIDISTILLDEKIVLQGPTPRTIGSHCRYKQTLLYKKYIINNFAEHDIEARSEQLLYQTPYTEQGEKVKLEQLLNKLDTQVTQILLKAEKKFGSDPLKQLIRNNEITQYQHIIRYWITFISGRTHKQNMTSILQGILNLIDPEMRLHIHDFITRPQTGLSKVKQLLQDAKAASALHLKEAEEIEYAMLAEADNVSSERVRDNRTRAKYTKKLFAQ